jgi:hypothetical protein
MAGLWNGCPAKGVASGDAVARVFLPQRVDFDPNLLTQFLSASFDFRFKKTFVSFSLIQINCPLDMWRDCGVVVQQRGAASGDAAARGGTRISRVDFDLNLLTQFLSDSFAFRFKKKLVSFSLIQINRLR